MPAGTWAAHWNVGDYITAVELNKSVGSVSDTTTGGAVASIDITGIVTTYAHLRFILSARGDTAASTTTVGIRFNNDSGANYSDQYVQGQVGSPGAAETNSATSALLTTIPAASATANMFTAVECFIADYANTTRLKGLAATQSIIFGMTSGGHVARVTSAVWNSTAAINRITLIPGAGNFVAGSRLTIYAMGA